MDAGGSPIVALERWEAFGGTWRIASRFGSSVVVSLCRCDGGEEVERLESADPDLLAWLDAQPPR